MNFGEQKGEELFKWWKEEFGEDFYVQIQNHGLYEEEHVNQTLLQFAEKYDVKILAQNETFYTEKSDAKYSGYRKLYKKMEKNSQHPLVEVLGRGED